MTTILIRSVVDGLVFQGNIMGQLSTASGATLEQVVSMNIIRGDNHFVSVSPLGANERNTNTTGGYSVSQLFTDPDGFDYTPIHPILTQRSMEGPAFDIDGLARSFPAPLGALR